MSIGKIVFKDESRTKKSFKEAVDINKIMMKFTTYGTIPFQRSGNGLYGDFTGVEEYQSSLNKLIKARNEFESLPSSVRKRFGNDPVELLKFVSDPKNIDEMIKMGIAKNEPVNGDKKVINDVVDNIDKGKVESKK